MDRNALEKLQAQEDSDDELGYHESTARLDDSEHYAATAGYGGKKGKLSDRRRIEMAGLAPAAEEEDEENIGGMGFNDGEEDERGYGGQRHGLDDGNHAAGASCRGRGSAGQEEGGDGRSCGY